jgi:hypothetical protein
MEEQQVELLKQFIRTPKVGGNNRTANSFSSCVHTVAVLTHKKLKQYTVHLKTNTGHPLPKNDRFIVREIRRHLAEAYNRFHYSPNNTCMESQPIGRLVFILFGTQMSALFMVDRILFEIRYYIT